MKEQKTESIETKLLKEVVEQVSANGRVSKKLYNKIVITLEND